MGFSFIIAILFDILLIIFGVRLLGIHFEKIPKSTVKSTLSHKDQKEAEKRLKERLKKMDEGDKGEIPSNSGKVPAEVEAISSEKVTEDLAKELHAMSESFNAPASSTEPGWAEVSRRCPRCGCSNTQTTKFCVKCSQPL